MKKILLLLGFASVAAYAQTGINTTAPTATLDIKARTTDGSQVEGTVLPAQSKAALAALQANGKTPADGTLVFVNDATTGTGTTVANVFDKGYYIFNDGTWNKMTFTNQPDKTYKCTTANIGQVIKSTEGNFVCTGTYDPANPAWRYEGIMHIEGTFTGNTGDGNIQIAGHFTLDTNNFTGDEIWNSWYAQIALVNGKDNASMYDRTTPSQPFIANGVANELPSYGVIYYYYYPWQYCVRPLMMNTPNALEGNTMQMVTGIAYSAKINGVDCQSNEYQNPQIRSSIRRVDFRILD